MGGERERPTPFSLVLIGLGCLLFGLVVAWTTLPWPHAAMATCLGYLGMQVGMDGARWVDEQGPQP